MLIRGVVEDHIQDNANAALVGFFQKAAEIIERAVFRGHIAIVRHIVAAIGLWGGIVRREP